MSVRVAAVAEEDAAIASMAEEALEKEFQAAGYKLSPDGVRVAVSMEMRGVDHPFSVRIGGGPPHNFGCARCSGHVLLQHVVDKTIELRSEVDRIRAAQMAEPPKAEASPSVAISVDGLKPEPVLQPHDERMDSRSIGLLAGGLAVLGSGLALSVGAGGMMADDAVAGRDVPRASQTRRSALLGTGVVLTAMGVGLLTAFGVREHRQYRARLSASGGPGWMSFGVQGRF